MVRINKLISVILLIAMLLPLICFSASAAPPVALCQNIYMYDTTTGSVLYEKDSGKKVAPGGLVKLITAIVAIENFGMDDIVTVSANASDPDATGGGKNRVKYGEEVTVHDLLYMMMLSSSNEAAIALAEHAGGSVDGFVGMMNKKVREIGAVSTNLENPTGYDSENQYTTAADYAKIVGYARKNSTINDIVNTAYIKLSPTDLTPGGRHVYSENHLISKLLQSDKYFYSQAEGMAFGYTSQAGYCLASSAQSKSANLSLVIVVMGGSKEGSDDPIPSFIDAKNFLEWGLESFEVKKVLTSGDITGEANVEFGKGKDYVTVAVKDDMTVLMPVGSTDETIIKDVHFNDEIIAPVEEGDVLGTVSVTYQGVVYATSDIYAVQSVERSGFLYLIDRISSFFKQKIVKIIIVILILLVVFYIGVTVMANLKRQRRLRNSRNRRMNRRI